jgi:aminotransferase
MNVSPSPRKRVASHIASIPKSGIRDFFEIVSTMKDVISLGIGEPDFVTPWHIREAMIYALNKGVTSYTSNLGLLQLRQEVCRYVTKEFGAPEYDPARECIITVGVSEALDLALRAILEPGDEVVYHEPCYVSYRPSITMAHAIPVAVVTREKDDFALRPEALEAAITPRTKALLLNYPNNPTGAILTAEQKQAIARIAVRHDLVVLTDEIYTELSYEDVSQTIAALPGMRERTIFLNGFSKAYAMTGSRIGYACGPFDIIDAMMKIHQYSMLCASSFVQLGALEALKNGSAPRHAMWNEYHQRRNVIVKRLNEMGLPCFMPRGAFYAFPRISHLGISSKDFAFGLLEQHKVAVVPGSAFGSCGEGYVRCAYATGLEDIEEAMRRMKIYVESLQKKK